MPGPIVDMHVHTVRGAADSSLTPDQLIEEAKRIGLTGVNISEHDRGWGARQIQEVRGRRRGLASRAGGRGGPGDGPGVFVTGAPPSRPFSDPIPFRRGGRPPFEMTTEEAAER